MIVVGEDEVVAETGEAVEFSHRRVSEKRVRVYTTKQMLGMLAIVSGLWAAGGKYLIDSYIDEKLRSAIYLHNHDEDAHGAKLKQFVVVSEQKDRAADLERKIDALNTKLSEVSISLAEMRGELRKRPN